MTQPPPPHPSQPPPPDPSTRLDAPAPAGPVEVPTAGWGAARSLAGLAILLVAVSIEAAIVAGFDPDIEALGARLALQVALAVSLVLVSVIAVQGAGLLPGTSPLAALGIRRSLRPAVAVSILAYLVYVAIALVIAALLNPEQEDVTRELGVDEGTLGVIAAGFLIVVAAPLSEEIFFRGFLFAGIRRSSGFILGAVVSSGIWGLFHYTGPDSWPVILQLATFGIVLAWLYERTGSIWPPIAVHAFNNAVAFTVLTS